MRCKCCRVSRLKPRPNDRNISMQHIATLLSTEKSLAEIWSEMKLFHPPPPYFFRLSLFASSVLSHHTWSNFKVDAKFKPRAKLNTQGTVMPNGTSRSANKIYKDKALLWKIWVPGQKCESFFTLSLLYKSGRLQQVSVNTSTNDLLAPTRKITKYWR